MIVWSFLIAFGAWATYRFAIGCDDAWAPRLARASMAVLGAALLVSGSLFALTDWWQAIEHPKSGWLVIFTGFMLALAPVGLWCFGLAIGDGWFNAALVLRQVRKDEAAKLEIRAESLRRADMARAYRDAISGERNARRWFGIGRAVGRWWRR